MDYNTAYQTALSPVMKAHPTPGDVHVNALVTNICVAYFQSKEGFVAGQVFPEIPVDKNSNVYPIWNNTDFNKDVMKKRAPSTESVGGGIAPTTDSFFCEVRAFHIDLDDQLKANFDAQFRNDAAVAEYLGLVDLISREIAWTSKYFTTGIWATNKVGGSDFTKWDDDASDPLKDIEAAKLYMLEETGFEPNTLVLGAHVLAALRIHPAIIDRVKYAGMGKGNPALTTLSDLAYLFGIDRILPMKAIKNTAAEGVAASNAFIGGKNALLAYSNMGKSILMPSAGYTFNWNGYTGAGQNGARVRSFRMENIHSDRYEIESAWDQKLVASSMGYFFSEAANVISSTTTN
jgi:hypothetical protein